jgi:protein tyrosine/serine phosphatase
MPMLRCVTRWLVPLTLGAVLASLATVHFMRQRDVRHPVLPIEPGVLYRSGKLSPEKLAEEVRRRGIKTVVNLAGDEHSDEAACQELGIKYVNFPVGDVWCLCGQKSPGQQEAPAGPMDIEPLWRLIDDPQTSPVLIHCTGGVHRTGVVAALYRIRYQGWDAADAITEMDLYGFDSRKQKFDNVKEYLHGFEQQMASAKQAAAGHVR